MSRMSFPLGRILTLVFQRPMFDRMLKWGILDVVSVPWSNDVLCNKPKMKSSWAFLTSVDDADVM